MGAEQVKSTVKKYAEAIKEDINPYALYLFGSFAKGTANENSDIDIAVVLQNFKGDTLKTIAMLYRKKIPIDLRIEPHIFNLEDNDPFLDEIIKTGEKVN